MKTVTSIDDIVPIARKVGFIADCLYSSPAPERELILQDLPKNLIPSQLTVAANDDGLRAFRGVVELNEQELGWAAHHGYITAQMPDDTLLVAALGERDTASIFSGERVEMVFESPHENPQTLSILLSQI